jgi:hypothetical protein
MRTETERERERDRRTDMTKLIAAIAILRNRRLKEVLNNDRPT